MRTLSSAFSGTDVAHHRHFTGYAEAWRQNFVDSLNEAFSEKQVLRAGLSSRTELWKNAPEFDYQPPKPTYGFDVHLLSAVALLGWFLPAFLRTLGSQSKVV